MHVTPSPSAPSNAAGKIVSLQWLRFVAATMVVLYHASVYLQAMRGDTYAKFVPSWFGAVGVALFFALSGNLMASLMQRSDASTYLMHRVVRIYPIYYVVVGAMVLASFFSPIQAVIDWHALSLFPYGLSSYPLGVEWTLVFEVAFYVFVFALMLFRKTDSAVSFLVGWLALIALNNVLRPDDPRVNVYHPFVLPFVTVNVAFAAGMLLPLWLKDRMPHPVLAAVIGVALFYVGFSQGVMPGRWCLGFGSALFVSSLAVHVPRWHWPQLDAIGDKLGAYSYAIYLCHVPVIRTLYAVTPDQSGRTLFWWAVGLALLIALPLGELDVRLYRWFKRRVDRSTALFRQVGAFLFVAAFFFAAWLAI